MKYKLFILLSFILLSVNIVTAVEPTQQYAKIYMNPLYNIEMEDNVWYDYTLTINTPDGISSISNAMITMQLWLNPTVIFDLEVNGQTCNNPQYQVHTTFAGAGEGTIFFDCSNIITGEGTYDVRIMSSKNTGASTFWIDLTYFNNPKADITIHGTEYTYDGVSMAKVWLQLINSTTDYVDNAICLMDIYTPDNQQYLEKATMSYLEDGIYYYDLIVPFDNGVYPAIAECFYDATQNKYSASSNIIYLGKNYANTYVATWVEDGTSHKIIEQNYGGIRIFETSYGFDSISVPIPNVTFGMTIYWRGKWNDQTLNDDVTISILNQTDDEWIELPNKVLAIDGWQIVSNFIPATDQNLSELGYISLDGDVDILFNSTRLPDGGNTVFSTDYLYVSTDVAGSGIWQEVKGSSELHVKSENPFRFNLLEGDLVNESLLEYFTFKYQVTTSSSSDDDVDVHFHLWKPFPCDHVENVTLEYPNLTTVNLNFTTSSNWFGGDRCTIHTTFFMESGVNYNVYIKSENWWKKILLNQESTVEINTEVINNTCNDYITENNLMYPTLLANNLTNINDTFFLSCILYKDAYEHYVEVSTPFFNMIDINSTFDFDTMEILEEQWIHLEYIVGLLNEYGNVILNNMNYYNSYSGYILNNSNYSNYTMFFANLSSSNSMSAFKIWNYSDRTLTDFNFSVPVDINTTEISESVWNYNGSINQNLLNQFVSSFWNWTGSISNMILDAISVAVWENPSRNLTYSPPATVNTTEIANATWEWDARYTHGVELS